MFELRVWNSCGFEQACSILSFEGGHSINASPLQGGLRASRASKGLNRASTGLQGKKLLRGLNGKVWAFEKA